MSLPMFALVNAAGAIFLLLLIVGSYWVGVYFSHRMNKRADRGKNWGPVTRVVVPTKPQRAYSQKRTDEYNHFQNVEDAQRDFV